MAEPTLSELIARRVDRLDSVPDLFASRIVTIQSNLMQRLTALMGELDTVGGKIANSADNLRRVDEIINTLINNDMMEGDYRKAVKDFVQQFDVQARLTDQYYSRVVDGFARQPIYIATIAASQRYTLQALTQTGLAAPFTQVVQQQLSLAVSTGETFGNAVTRMRTFIVGTPEVDGKLLRYAKLYAYDAFAVNDRRYGQIVAYELGFEWFRYRGGLIKDSREFCVERDDKAYHRAQVAEWGTIKQWQGRREGTDESTIFTFLGGYNCKHTLIGVSEMDVPVEDLRAAMMAGYYQPPEFVKKRLGL